MIRLIAGVFALAVATSAQAMSLAPLAQSESLITQVRDACGAGMHMVNGKCVTTSARRHVRRDVIRGYRAEQCAAGMHIVNGRCVTTSAPRQSDPAKPTPAQ